MAHVGEVNLQAVPWRNTEVRLYKLPRVESERRSNIGPLQYRDPDALLWVGEEGSLVFDGAPAYARLAFVDGEGNELGALRVVARESGEDGNELTVELVDPETPNASLAITGAPTGAIEIWLAADNDGKVTSTLADIADAIAADVQAAAVIRAVVEGDPDTVAEAVATTALDGGTELAEGFWAAVGLNPYGAWEYITFRYQEAS